MTLGQSIRSSLTTYVTALALAALSCLSVACVDDGADVPESTDAALALEHGGQLMFFVDEDGEVSILEAAPTPRGLGLIRAMNEAGRTPAELWISIGGDEAIPGFLLDHHERVADRAPEQFAVDAREFTGFRAMAHSQWGGFAGYCDSGFAADFEALNEVETTVDVSGSTSTPLYGYSGSNAMQAWMGVCNNAALNTGTGTRLRLSRYVPELNTYTPFQCENPPGGSAGWCNWIGDQQAKALHFWTTKAGGYTLRFEALWAGGVHHPSLLKAGSTTTPKM